MPLDLNAGTQTASGPSRFSALERTAQIARELAGRSGLTDLSAPASLDLRFADQFGYRKNAVTDGAETFEGRLDMLATISRSSLAYNPNWSFRSGDAVGRLEEVAANVLRYNQPPNTAGGRLLETAAATNKIRNPRCEGDDAALPSQFLNVTSGTTVSVIGRGVENGWPYLEVRWSGTPTADPALYFEGTTQVAASTGQSWSLSAGLKLTAGDLTNITAVSVRVLMRDSGGANLAIAHAAEVTPTSTHRRFFTAGTATHASLAYVMPGIILDWDGSGAIDITLRIYLPQLEQASAPTSPIMPPEDSPAEATRAAETVTEGVTCTRASRAYAMEWDWTSGGRVGPLKEFLQNTVRQGEWGIRREPTSTNKVRNPRFVGASSPSTWPTYMTVGAAGGMTWTCDGRGTDQYGDYLQITLSGTATGDARFDLEQSTYIPGVNGDNRVLSLGLRVISGVMPGQPKLALFELTSGGSIVVGHLSSAIAPDRQCRRYYLHKTLSGGGTTAYVRPGLYIDDPSGAVACTFRLYYPQVEYGIRPSSPILPPPNTVAEATRDVERVYMTLGGALNAEGWTLYTEYAPALDTTTGFSASTPFIVSLQANSGTAGYGVFYQSGANAIPRINSGSSAIGFGSAQGAMVPGATRRMALAYAANDMAASADGQAQLTDTSGTIAETLTQIELGAIQGGSHWQGDFRAVRLFPARLPNAELEALVGN